MTMQGPLAIAASLLAHCLLALRNALRFWPSSAVRAPLSGPQSVDGSVYGGAHCAPCHQGHPLARQAPLAWHCESGVRCRTTGGKSLRCMFSTLFKTSNMKAFLFVLAPLSATPALAEDGGLHPALIALSVLLLMLPSVWFMFRAYHNCRFSITAVTNDNPTAIEQFNDVLRQADSELLIHDDGDQVSGTVYNDDRTIQAVRRRLNECQKLKIRCLFNFNEDVEMAKLSSEFGTRFQVRFLHQRSPGDVHFKIADRGKWAYLSTHLRGDTERDGEICDGTLASERVRRRYVGHLVEAFEEGFEKAHLQ